MKNIDKNWSIRYLKTCTHENFIHLVACLITIITLTGTTSASPIRAAQFWPKGIYLNLQTYDGHSQIGMRGAVDFFYMLNHTDTYHNNLLGKRMNTPLLAPFAGTLTITYYERPVGYDGEFTFINKAAVIAGTDAVPHHSLSFRDANGQLRLISFNIIVEAQSYRSSFIHSSGFDSLFTTALDNQIRNGIATIDKQTVGNGYFALNTGIAVSQGQRVGTLYGWDAAKTNPHVHVNFYSGPASYDSKPSYGTLVDLTDTTQITLDGQCILDPALKQQRTESWLSTGKYVYQYPAMPRNNFKTNDSVRVSASWAGQHGAECRATVTVSTTDTLGNGRWCKIVDGPVKGDYSLWYQGQSATGIFWVKSENLIKTDIDTIPPTFSSTLQLVELSDTSVKFKWPTAKDNLDVKDYRIFKDGDFITSTDQLYVTINGLSPNTTYIFTATATDIQGNESLPTNGLTITTSSPLDVSDLTENSILVYPNPASSGLINIRTDENTTNGSSLLLITNLNGKVFKEENIGQNNSFFQLNIEDLESGIYLVTIKTNKGVINKKLLVY